MNNLKLNITDKAKEDIRKITRYISKDNKEAAKNLSKDIYELCQKLTRFPEMGSVRLDFTYKDYRFITIRKHYIIAYRVLKNELFVSRVLSGYEDICALF